MSSFSKNLALLIGGALVGATVALLLPAEKSEELRHKINDLADEAKKRAHDYCEQVKHDLENIQHEPESPEAQTEKEAKDGK